MIKGVNKQVLEINEVENSFFEKAIFFVKPEYSGLSEGKLRKIAEKKLCDTGAPPDSKKNLRKFFAKRYATAALFIAMGVVLGIVISVIAEL